MRFIKYLPLVLGASALVLACERRPESVPSGAIYTGTLYSDGEWIHCTDLTVGQIAICNIYSKGGSEFESGRFLVDADPSRFTCDTRAAHCVEFVSRGPATFLHFAYVPNPSRYLVRLNTTSTYGERLHAARLWHIVNPECAPLFQAFDYDAIRRKGIDIRASFSVAALLDIFIPLTTPALVELPVEIKHIGKLDEKRTQIGEANEAGLSVEFNKDGQRYEAVFLDGCTATLWHHVEMDQ